MSKFKVGDLVKPMYASSITVARVDELVGDKQIKIKILDTISFGSHLQGQTFITNESEFQIFKLPRLNDDCTPQQEPVNPKASLHMVICNELTKTYEVKNADYGDSFAQVRQRVPNAILVRLFDKLLRLETLLNGAEAQVKDESIEDTLLDMANYCIMEVIERRAKE